MTTREVIVSLIQSSSADHTNRSVKFTLPEIGLRRRVTVAYFAFTRRIRQAIDEGRLDANVGSKLLTHVEAKFMGA